MDNADTNDDLQDQLGYLGTSSLALSAILDPKFPHSAEVFGHWLKTLYIRGFIEDSTYSRIRIVHLTCKKWDEICEYITTTDTGILQVVQFTYSEELHTLVLTAMTEAHTKGILIVGSSIQKDLTMTLGQDVVDHVQFSGTSAAFKAVSQEGRIFEQIPDYKATIQMHLIHHVAGGAGEGEGLDEQEGQEEGENMGQAYLRLYIALDTMWTKYGAMSDNRLQDREHIMQKVMQQVKAHHNRDGHHPKELRAAFKAVKGEEGETVRKAMTDVVWTAASQMRNDLKKKAKLVAEEAYDLSNLSSKQKEVLAVWLTQSYKQPLRGGVLMGAGKKAILDKKNCSVDLRKPFQHPAIWQLVHSYWFSGSGNSELKVPQECFSKVPNNLIALVCNVLEAALRDVVHPDMQFLNKIYALKWDDHMALLEEIEHTSPDAHTGIKKKIWDKVSAKLTAEQNTIGIDHLGLMEGAPQGIPFDNLVVDDDDDDEQSDKEVDELEGSVPPQPTSVVANVQEQDAIAEDLATRSRLSQTSHARGQSAVTSGGGTSDRDAAGAAAGMLNPADQVDQVVREAALVEEPSARGEKQSAGASESDGATAARTDSLRAPEAGVSKPAP
ncbi:hypothetical protein C8Q72DRAFT_886582 [Fomitopsis betulina]|nr:hypothetical protein C8Q72DRAFT_886582 [Fomitopsis betulina]